MHTAARLLAVAALAGTVGCTAQASLPGSTYHTDGGTGHFGGGPGGGGGTSGVCGTAASFGTDALDLCINNNCCGSFDACHADAACAACLTNPGGSGCATNTAFSTFNACAVNSCGTSGGGGGGGGGAGGGGSGICGSGASFGDATVDTCVNANCCSSFNPCFADTACQACLADPTATGCSSNTKLTAFASCLSTNCNSGGGGGGGGGGTTDVCGSGASTGNATTDACLTASCCTPFNACIADTACTACLGNPTATGCSTNTKLTAFSSCASTNCSGGGGGGGGGGTGGICGSSYTIDTTTDACLSQYCCTSFDACVANTTCLACETGSTTTGCSSNAQMTAFEDCASTNCGGGGGGTCATGHFGDPTFESCVNASCCSPLDACVANTACLSCISASSPPSSCGSNSLYTAWSDCLTANGC
ncbi:MAG TPA: hypothetical protein VGQ83_21855 [Polyangia bacterium]